MNGSFNFTFKKLIELSLHVGVFPNLKFIPITSIENNNHEQESHYFNKTSFQTKNLSRHPETATPYQISEESLENILNEGTQ